jgi:hypothetical protein
MGLGDAALPRLYAVRLLRCKSPAFFSVPIMPAGPSQERSSALGGSSSSGPSRCGYPPNGVEGGFYEVA